MFRTLLIPSLLISTAFIALLSGKSPEKVIPTETLGNKTVLGNGVVVQGYSILEPDGQSKSPRNVRVIRDGCVIYERALCSSAEYYTIKDLNGNGSLDFRYGYGSQGSGNLEYSEIIDPLFHTIFQLDCETFYDIDGDGSLEAIARDHGLSYQWNYGVDEIDVRVIRKWTKGFFLPLGWKIDPKSCYKPPPNEVEFGNLILEMQSCLSTKHTDVLNTWADDMYDSKGSYLGCIAPKMAELCYTGHPELAFKLLDKSWQGNTKDKIAFEEKFIEELRNAEYVEVTTKFRLFDIAGRRRLEHEQTSSSFQQ